MKYGEKIALMFVAFMLAVIFSWLPWLMYGVVASVFTSLTPIGAVVNVWCCCIRLHFPHTNRMGTSHVLYVGNYDNRFLDIGVKCG